MADNREKTYSAYLSETFNVNLKPTKEEASHTTIVPDASQIKTDVNLARINRVNDYSVSSDSLIRDWNALNVSSKMPGTRGVFLDIETLGEQGKDFFTPTEIAMRTYHIQNGFQLTDVLGTSGSSLTNFAVRPDANTSGRISELINSLQVSKKANVFNINGNERTLTDYEYRSLYSLMRYSDERVFGKTAFGNNEYGVITNDMNALRGISLPEYGVSLKTHVDRIKKGYANLMTYGSNLEQTIEGINGYMMSVATHGGGKLKDVHLVTFNGKTADIPWLNNAFSSVRGKSQAVDNFVNNVWNDLTTRTVDLYKMGNAFIRNPIGEVNELGQPGNWVKNLLSHGRQMVGGLFRIENMHQMMKGMKEAYHFAGIDVNATAELFTRLGNPIQSALNGAKGNGYQGLRIDNTPIKFARMGNDGLPMDGTGDLFFSRGGISSSDSRFSGGIFKYGNGRFSSQFGTNSPVAPLYKNTYYKFMGFQDLDDGGSAAVLFNMDEGQYHYISGTGPKNLDVNAMKQLLIKNNPLIDINKDDSTIKKMYRDMQRSNVMNTLYSKLEYVPGVDENPAFAGKVGGRLSTPPEPYKLIDIDSKQDAVMQDRAMRRYRKMYDVEAGGGYNLWAQNHEALGVLQQFKSTNNSANKTKAEILNAIMQDSKTIEAFEKIYSTDYFGEGNPGKYTSAKVRDLVYMQDALIAEQSMVGPFKSMLGKSVIDSAQSGLKISHRTASQALMYYRDKVGTQYGKGAVTRSALDHERFLPVFNPNGNSIKLAGYDSPLYGGKTMSYIDVSSVESTIKGVDSIISSHFPINGTNMAPATEVSRRMINDLKKRGVISGDIGKEIMDIVKTGNTNPTAFRQSVSRRLGIAIHENVDNFYRSAAQSGGNIHSEMGIWQQINTGMEMLALPGDGVAEFQSIASKALNEAIVLTNNSTFDPTVQSMFGDHNAAIDNKRVRALKLLQGNSEATQSMFKKFNVEKMRKAEDSIAHIAAAYKIYGFETRLLNDDGTLKVALYKDTNLRKLHAQDIINHKDAIVFNMPILDKNGTISVTDRMKRLNQFIVDKEGTGLSFKTGFDFIVDEIADSARYMSQVYDTHGKNGAYAARTVVKRRINDAVSWLSGLTEKYADTDAAGNIMRPRAYANAIAKSDVLVFRSQSMISSFLKEQAIKANAQGQKGKAKMYEDLSGKKDLKLEDLEPAQLVQFDNYALDQSVFEKGSSMITMRDIVRYTSTKENEALLGLVSMNDVRRYMPFGRFISGTTQRARQALNIRDIRPTAEMTSDPYLNSILNRPMLMTKEFATDMQDTISGAVLKTAYMSDTTILKRIEELHSNGQISDTEYNRLKNVKFPTSYEGQIIMSDKVAPLFSDVEIKEHAMGEGFVLTDRFKKIQAGETESIGAGRGRSVTVGGIAKYSTVTIEGDIASMSQGSKNALVREQLAKNLGGTMLIDDAEITGLTPENVGPDNNGIIQSKVKVQYIDIEDKNTLKYKHEFGADVFIKDDMITMKQVAEMSTMGVKASTAHGFKGTLNLLDDNLVKLIGGGAEVIMYGQAIKKSAAGEHLTSYFNTALNNATAFGLDNDTAMNNIANVLSKTEGIDRSAVSMQNGKMVYDFNMNSEVTAGSVMLNSVQNQLATAIGATSGEFESLISKTGNNYSYSYGYEEWRRNDVGEDLKVKGSVGRSDVRSLASRQGIFKVGVREIHAVETAVGPNGERMKPVAEWLKGYVEDLSAYQNPELSGNKVWYDTKFNRYVTNMNKYRDEIGPAEYDAGRFVQQNNKLKSVANIITGDIAGVTVASDGNFVDLMQDNVETIGDVSKKVTIQRGMFSDIVTRRIKGAPLTGDDFNGTIVDIGNTFNNMSKFLNDESPEAANLLNLHKRVHNDGGFYLQLAHQVEVEKTIQKGKNRVSDGKELIDKIWVPLEPLVTYDDADNGTTQITTGKLNTLATKIDATNREMMLFNENKYSQELLQKLEGVDTGDVQKVLNKHSELLSDRLQGYVKTYRSLAGTMVSGTDGLANAATTAKLEHSGQFRVQIMSPTMSKEIGGGAQMIINQNDFDTMVYGEMRNGERVGGMSVPDRDFMKAQDGIYAMAGRYPTNYSQSISIAKLTTAGDDIVTSGEALITPGMIATMLGDADGDFTSITLAHYNSDTYTKALNQAGKQSIKENVLGSMSSYHKAASTEYARVGEALLEDMTKTYKKFGLNIEELRFSQGELAQVTNLFAGNVNEANFDSFLGSLQKGGYMDKKMGAEEKAALFNLADGNKDFVANNLLANIEAVAQNTGIGEAEAFAARELRRNIGGFSNMSFKVREIGNIAQKISESMGSQVFSVGDLQVLDSGMQLIEQSSISSKHLSMMSEEGINSVETARQAVRDRMENARNMKTALLSGDRETFLSLNDQLGVFKSIDPSEDKMNGLGNYTKGKYQKGSAENVFDTVTKLRNIFGGEDLNTVIQRPELSFGLSNGVFDPNDINTLLDGPPSLVTPQLEQLYKKLGREDIIEQANVNMEKRIKFLEENPLYNSSYNSTMEKTVGTETTKAVASMAGDLTSTPFVAGAVTFAGLWAASAMFREGPADRAKADNTDAEQLASEEQYQNGPYIPQAKMGGPTARISPIGGGYENLQINVRASSFNGMSNDEIIALISSEMQNQSPVRMDINATTRDQSTQVDRQWVNDVVSRATRYGMGF